MKQGLRMGFTTGSCAAAAAKGAAYMLLSGRDLVEVSIEMPSGREFSASLLEVRRGEDWVSCAVKKDAGDDPDVTDGVLVFARVAVGGDDDLRFGVDISHMVSDGFGTLQEDVKRNVSDGSCAGNVGKQLNITIDGGDGVGRVTMPGLDQPVGAAAINAVPRRMIREAVEEVCRLLDFCGSLSVVISVPNGQRIAKQTMNERLGIVGGISILGTTGIVSPMSADALLAAIRLEIRQKKVLGAEVLPLAIGNYGRQFLKEEYGFDVDTFVKCSNFIGDAIQTAVEEGFDKVLLVGHIGKLVKVAGGKLNTHSKYGDCRMELLASSLIECGGDAQTVRGVLGCVSTEEALRWIDGCGLLERVMKAILDKIMDTFNNKFGGLVDVECLVFSNVFGMLGMSDGVDRYISIIK